VSDFSESTPPILAGFFKKISALSPEEFEYRRKQLTLKKWGWSPKVSASSLWLEWDHGFKARALLQGYIQFLIKKKGLKYRVEGIKEERYKVVATISVDFNGEGDREVCSNYFEHESVALLEAYLKVAEILEEGDRATSAS
jgi:hypothetical protein